jgi:hypothetical protein
MTNRRWNFFGMLGMLVLLAASSAHAESGALQGAGSAEVSIESDETLVFVHEAKKLEVRVRISGASTAESAPKWNLVQVEQDGRFLRYIGILYFSPKKQAFFRKLELQEREPGQRYFEVVPDAELEPFVMRPRTRLVIDVAARPSLIEIMRGIWKKILGQIPAVFPEASAAESLAAPGAVPAAGPCRAKLGEGWSAFSGGDLPAGARIQKGARAEGGAFAALQSSVELPLEKVADQLWNPNNIKNPRNTRIQVEELASSSPGFRAKRLQVNLRPFLFVNLDWQELWQRSDVASGESVRIDYQKTAGEAKLKHFCGWMEARKLGPSKTEVTLYEEIDSSHRSADDVAKGHVGTIGMLLKTLKR